jgi:hypothetical protein
MTAPDVLIVVLARRLSRGGYFQRAREREWSARRERARYKGGKELRDVAVILRWMRLFSVTAGKHPGR